MSNYTEEDAFYAAVGAFSDALNLNGTATKEEIEEAREALIEFHNGIPGFDEQAEKVYKQMLKGEISGFYVQDEIKQYERVKELNDLAVKMGIAEPLSDNEIELIIKTRIIPENHNSSKCCLLL